MDGEEACQRRARDGLAPERQAGNELADDRDVAGKFGADHRRPIGLHVPRQQIAGETEPQRDQQQADAADPGQLRGAL